MNAETHYSREDHLLVNSLALKRLFGSLEVETAQRLKVNLRRQIAKIRQEIKPASLPTGVSKSNVLELLEGLLDELP